MGARPRGGARADRAARGVLSQRGLQGGRARLRREASGAVEGPVTLRATRYVAPLREGGSLPGLVEASDDGLYVAKFRGAGQGPGALVAEIVGGELARALGLLVPNLVLLDIDPEFARAEPDPEIQDLIAASAGINLGVDFLPGALPFTAATDVGPEFAAD